MKTLAIVAAAAAAMLAIPAASAPVAAPSTVVSAAALANTQVRVSVGTTRHHYQRSHKRRAYYRRVCTNRYSHGHRVRTCRNVRAWR